MNSKTTLVELIKQASTSRSMWEVFFDFLEMTAISLRNAIEKNDQLEKRYLELINKYDQGTQTLFPRMLAFLVTTMDEEFATNGPTDVLGSIFNELKLYNEYTGQFFTPGSVSRLIGMLTVPEGAVEREMTITLEEPAVGSGSMVLDFASSLKEKGFNFQQNLLVVARDIDIRCVHMAYIQFTLYHIPAVITHGNTLTGEEWSTWHTPAYILGGWSSKYGNKR